MTTSFGAAEVSIMPVGEMTGGSAWDFTKVFLPDLLHSYVEVEKAKAGMLPNHAPSATMRVAGTTDTVDIAAGAGGAGGINNTMLMIGMGVAALVLVFFLVKK